MRENSAWYNYSEVGCQWRLTRLIPFALNNFKYFITLFSKVFSSFPHGTCSLSVSRQYLALDGAYHPLSARVPTYTTLSTGSVPAGIRATDGTITLYGCAFQTQYRPDPTRWMPDFRLQPDRAARPAGFQFELFPLHSPLLRESLLVSFPPPNNMLKFSGFSRLT